MLVQKSGGEVTNVCQKSNSEENVTTKCLGLLVLLIEVEEQAQRGSILALQCDFEGH